MRIEIVLTILGAAMIGGAIIVLSPTIKGVIAAWLVIGGLVLPVDCGVLNAARRRLYIAEQSRSMRRKGDTM